MNEVQRETWRQLHEVWTRGEALRGRQRWDEAVLALDQSLELAMTSDDRLTIALLGFQLAQVRLRLDHLEGAQEAVQVSLEAAQAGALESLQPWILLLQGDIARQAGAVSTALTCWRRAEAEFERLGREVGRAIVLKRLAELPPELVTPEDARLRLERSVRLARLENQVGLEAAGWRGLARLHLLELSSRIGNLPDTSGQDISATKAGQVPLEFLLPVFRLLDRAKEASQSIGDQQALGHEQLLRVDGFWRTGDLWRAEQCLRQARTLLESVGDAHALMAVNEWRRRLTWWRVLRAWLMAWLDQWLGRSTPALPPGAS